MGERSESREARSNRRAWSQAKLKPDRYTPKTIFFGEKKKIFSQKLLRWKAGGAVLFILKFSNLKDGHSNIRSRCVPIQSPGVYSLM